MTLLVGVSALNFIAVRFYRAELLSNLRQDAELHLRSFERGHRLPSYIRISEIPLRGEDLVLFNPSYKGKFVFLDLSIAKRKLRNFALNLLLWESFLVLSLGYVFYKLLWRYVKEREQNRQFLELMLLILSHRIGNFLAAQRVNIEMLKEGAGSVVLERLEGATSYMEDQFRRTVELIRRFPKAGEGVEEVDLKELLQRVLVPFEGYFKDKRLQLELEDVKVKAPHTDLEMMVYLLVENSARYSRGYVRISLTKEGKGARIVLENDIAFDVPRGSGLGLELARRLAERIGARVEVSEGQGRFRQELFL